MAAMAIFLKQNFIHTKFYAFLGVKIVPSVVQQSGVKIALSVQQPLTLAAIYLSRVGVVGSVFAAALTV